MPKPADVIPLVEGLELVGPGTVGLVLVGVVVLVLVSRVGGDPVAVGFTSIIDLTFADELMAAAVLSAIDLVVANELVAAAVVILLLACTLPSGTCEVIITSVMYTTVVPKSALVRVSTVAPVLLVVIISILVVAVVVVTSVVLFVPVDITVVCFTASVVVSVIVFMIEENSSSPKPDPDMYIEASSVVVLFELS